eukprot:GHVU01171660.1.p2 GENE.GHVU01171660.1~~GHVU01171660.1.p2  ORF type:complete len:112 (-),score=5.49 GHVU01171660.1:573-908(-)
MPSAPAMHATFPSVSPATSPQRLPSSSAVLAPLTGDIRVAAATSANVQAASWRRPFSRQYTGRIRGDVCAGPGTNRGACTSADVRARTKFLESSHHRLRVPRSSSMAPPPD